MMKRSPLSLSLSQSVPDAVMMAVANCETAHEAWEAIRRMCVGEDRVQRVRVKELKCQLDRMKMADNESAYNFAQKLMTLIGEIRSMAGRWQMRPSSRSSSLSYQVVSATL